MMYWLGIAALLLVTLIVGQLLACAVLGWLITGAAKALQTTITGP